MTLETLKKRMGIDAAVTVYDDELGALLDAAKLDLKAAGVPSALLEGDDTRAQLAITAFVKANYGDDRQNSQRYTTIYREMAFRLALEPDTAGATEGGD